MHSLKKLLCLLLTLMLFLPTVVFAEDEEVSLFGELVKSELDEEDLAQWEEWEEEDLQDEDQDVSQEDQEAEALEKLAMAEENLADIDPNDLEMNQFLPDDYINILLLGIDSRTDVTDIGLSDVVIICSIHRETGAIKLTSILRDTCLTLPGYQNMNRINTAYKFGAMNGEKEGIKDGGPKLAMRTVNHNFDMNIQYFVTVNFFGLAAIINSLGGIDIELTKGEANRINYELRKEPLDKVDREKVEGVAGVHHLDGMQAVTYARLRHSSSDDNDFNRTARQRNLLNVLLKQVATDMSFDTMFSLMETALPYVYTNLPASVMLEVGLIVLNSDMSEKLANGEELVTQHRIPMDKCYGYKDVNGASMVWMNEKNFKLNKESIHKFIYGEYYAP